MNPWQPFVISNMLILKINPLVAYSDQQTFDTLYKCILTNEAPMAMIMLGTKSISLKKNSERNMNNTFDL